MSGFEGNATVEWKGRAGACYGNYTGSQAIDELYARFLSNASSLLISNETQTIRAAGDYWIVSSRSDLRGHSTVMGAFRGTVEAQDAFVKIGGTWLVANETWNLLCYDHAFISQRPGINQGC